MRFRRLITTLSLVLCMGSSLELRPASSDEPIRLRVLSYNIHHGAGVDGKLDLERISEVIRTARPDLVALQEVDSNVTRSGVVDQAKVIAKQTEMDFVFGANIDLQQGKYGNAILSRFPIRRHRNQKLPNIDDGEQRGLLSAVIQVPGLSAPVTFFATHLDHRRDPGERHASAKFIRAAAYIDSEGLAVLAGDLNDTPESETLRILSQAWERVNDKPLYTVPVNLPNRQIDFVLVRTPRRWRTVETTVLDEKLASDHRPILTVLEFSGKP